MLLLCVAITGLFMSVLPASASSNSTPALTTQIEAWSNALTQDVQNQSEPLVGLVETANAWSAGKATAKTLRVTISSDLPELQTLVQDLEHLQSPPSVMGAASWFLQAIELYVQAFRIEYAATDVKSRKLVRQLQLSAERVRDLGDRIYDLGTALVDAVLKKPPVKTIVKLPAPVPDWKTLDLAPGAPLGPLPKDTQRSSSSSQESSAASAKKWVAAVLASGVPSSARLKRHILSGTAADLKSLVVSTQTAVNRIGALRNPSDLVLVSRETRLGLLVCAESLQASLGSRVTSSASVSALLSSVADNLAILGVGLWDSELLGPRQIGFSPNLLNPTQDSL
jgi:hypothetical protein